MHHDVEGIAERERLLDSVPGRPEQVSAEDIRAAALLDQLSAVDSRASGLKGWRVWRVPLSSVLIGVATGIVGLSYRDPVGLLIYGSIILTQLVEVAVRRHVRRSLLRERELVLVQHEELLTLAAKWQEAGGDGGTS